VSDDTSPFERPDRAGEPDERLIAAVAERRDRDAFVVLFERYAGRVKGFLMRAGEPEGAAEEIAQEVMIAVWRKAGRFDGTKASAATWIFTIARNRRIDRLRRAGTAGAEAPEFEIDPEPAASAETGLAGADRDARVRDAVAALTGEQREVVRLAYFSGLSQSEIATRLDLPLGTVKSRQRLAFARLRDALGPDFVQELRDD
jgi:RNA polymerase sigma-70 factor (ECF subfamily)